MPTAQAGPAVNSDGDFKGDGFVASASCRPAAIVESAEEHGMTWIKTVTMEEDQRVKRAMEAQRQLYPIEYATPVHPANNGQSSSIVLSHSLIPDALFHAFSTFGALMSPDLPLERRQHEMIATMVSVTNRCVY
jgi:hypothetical protein